MAQNCAPAGSIALAAGQERKRAHYPYRPGRVLSRAEAERFGFDSDDFDSATEAGGRVYAVDLFGDVAPSAVSAREIELLPMEALGGDGGVDVRDWFWRSSERDRMDRKEGVYEAEVKGRVWGAFDDARAFAVENPQAVAKLCRIVEPGVQHAKYGTLPLGTVVMASFNVGPDMVCMWPGYVANVSPEEHKKEFLDGKDEIKRQEVKGQEIIKLFADVPIGCEPESDVGRPMLADLLSLAPFVLPRDGEEGDERWKSFYREHILDKVSVVDPTPLWGRIVDAAWPGAAKSRKIWGDFGTAMDLALFCARAGKLVSIDEMEAQARGALDFDAPAVERAPAGVPPRCLPGPAPVPCPDELGDVGMLNAAGAPANAEDFAKLTPLSSAPSMERFAVVENEENATDLFGLSSSFQNEQPGAFGKDADLLDEGRGEGSSGRNEARAAHIPAPVQPRLEAPRAAPNSAVPAQQAASDEPGLVSRRRRKAKGRGKDSQWGMQKKMRLPPAVRPERSRGALLPAASPSRVTSDEGRLLPLLP